MALGKVFVILGGLSVGFFLAANPAQAQSSPPVHKLGVLDAADPQLEDGSYFDSYEIAGSAGQRVSISLDSSEFDTFLGLMDSDGNLLISNDDASESNRNSYISLTLPADDTYTVVTTSFTPLSSGGYRLSMRNFSAPQTTAQSTQAGLEPVFNPFVLSLVGAVLSDFLSGGSSSASSYADPSQDPTFRDVNTYQSPEPTYRPPTPTVGGDRGFYGSDHTPW